MKLKDGKKRKITSKSRLIEIYRNPLGHDLLCKVGIYFRKDRRWATRPFVRLLKLEAILAVAKGFGNEFLETLLRLINSTSTSISDKKLTQANESEGEARAWWKEAVIYQIYPRSFVDGRDEDGIGDLHGIITKLDYLKELGIDCIWLSPIYDSPNADNGYDVRNYEQIMKEYGDSNDFVELVNGLHERGMKLIMDLVVNHTSDEHEWFQHALNEPDSKYRNYYFIREGSKDTPPNNWDSCFGGSAWNYYEKQGVWALHVFSKKQMDLNWDNPDVREDVENMINRWLERGVDGFRLDAVNLISKMEDLPDGNKAIGQFMGYCGAENYFYGPHLHDYLNELSTKCFIPHGAFSVGETPGLGMEMSKLITDMNRDELNIVFNFDHLESGGHLRFDDYEYNLNWYKDYMCEWSEHYCNTHQMALYFENHDNPRMISKISRNPEHRTLLAKLLATLLLTQKGTPFIYQGEEIGMANKKFSSMDDIEDVESKGVYEKLLKETGSEKKAFAAILAGSRDHGRSTMQWSSAAYGGFSIVKPWFETDDDYLICNVDDQLRDSDSVLNYYKKLIALRRENEDFIYSDIKIVNEHVYNYYSYIRGGFFIECNLCQRTIVKPKSVPKKMMNLVKVFGNYNDNEPTRLRPYEATIYRIVKEHEHYE